MKRLLVMVLLLFFWAGVGYHTTVGAEKNFAEIEVQYSISAKALVLVVNPYNNVTLKVKKWVDKDKMVFIEMGGTQVTINTPYAVVENFYQYKKDAAKKTIAVLVMTGYKDNIKFNVKRWICKKNVIFIGDTGSKVTVNSPYLIIEKPSKKTLKAI